MKKTKLSALVTSLVIIFLSLIQTGFAQATKTGKLSETLSEVYSYDSKDKKIKEGLYKVVDAQKKVLVTGYYRQNKKAGVWNYYSPDGTLIQQYNYSKDSLISNKDIDLGSFVRYSYSLPDVSISAGTKIEAPVKIGGANYGFFLLYETRQIPNELKNERNMTINAAMSYELIVGADGKLESWDIIYLDETLDKEVKATHQSIKRLPEDAYTFVPAKVDGKPIKSKVVYMIPLKIQENGSQRVGDTHNAVSSGGK